MTIKLADGRNELWQWDTGRKVVFDDETVKQAHFQKHSSGYGRTIDVDVEDGAAKIPDELLQAALPLTVYAYVGEELDGYTKIERAFTVKPRKRPAEYVFTPTEQLTLRQLEGIIGDLNSLTTTAKENLVAAINEAAKTGSGGSGSIDLRVADGYIQYSNDGGTTWENLIAIADLKGEKGDTGAPGPQGEPGERGPQGETGPQGPQGQTGPTGPQGETGPAGPAGQDGAPGKDGSPGKDGTNGAPGQDGYSPSASVSETDTGATITITDKTGTTTAEIKNGTNGKDGAPGKDGTNGKDGSPGAKGDPGATPNLQIGTVTTLPAGSDATASVSGTAENPLLNLGIPKGADGSGGSSAITTATETDITGLLMGEGGKVRKAVPDVDYLKTKELPTPVPSNDSGKYLRWFDVAGWSLGSLDLYTCNMVDVNGQYYCDQSPSGIQALVTAGKTIFAMLNGEPYLLTSLSAQAAVFTRVAGTTVTTITVSSDYTAALTTTELQPAGGSGGTDLSLGMTSAAVGQIAKITAVDENGKPTAWSPVDMPGEGEKAWTKIIDVTVTDSTPVFDQDGIDQATEIYIKWSNLQNATSTDSGQNLYINDTQVALAAVNVKKSGTTAYGWTLCKYNGLIWDIIKSNGAASNNNTALSTQNACKPYNNVEGIGKATKLRLSTSNNIYAPTSGRLEIWVK